jgi:hypothetical protein
MSSQEKFIGKMRLWSIHPKYLDAKGLVAVWREALLAQKVLEGKTKGYTNHPQLIRFKKTENPTLYIGTYLHHIYLEGLRRNYKFDRTKIREFDTKIPKIPVTRGQIDYEFKHLLKKLSKRDKTLYMKLKKTKNVRTHPIFYIIEGPVEGWEKTNY